MTFLVPARRATHLEHGADDNVFTQFYRVLRRFQP